MEGTDNSLEHIIFQLVVLPHNARVIAVFLPQQVGSNSVVCSAEALGTPNTDPHFSLDS